MPELIRVGLVDDHPVVREGLRVFLELSPDIVITVDAGGAGEAIRQLAANACDVLLLDLVLSGSEGGVTVFDTVQRRWPSMRILILTSYRDQASLAYLQSHGAMGYLDKSVEPDHLLQAIRLVARGHSVWKQTPAAATGTSETLTRRETEVLVRLTQGLSNKEVAAALKISEKTVKVHVSHLLAKLGVYDRTQAVIAAYQKGLVAPPQQNH